MIIDSDPFHTDNVTVSDRIPVVSFALTDQDGNDISVKNLTGCLLIAIPVYRNNPLNYTRSCQYYDESIRKWSSEGCTLDITFTNANQTVCCCNHLTAFSINWGTLSDLNNIKIDNIDVIEDSKKLGLLLDHPQFLYILGGLSIVYF